MLYLIYMAMSFCYSSWLQKHQICNWCAIAICNSECATDFRIVIHILGALHIHGMYYIIYGYAHPPMLV